MKRSVWLDPAASETSSTRSSAPDPPPRSRVKIWPTASGAPSSHTPVMFCRRSNIGLPATGPTTKVSVASPLAVLVAPSKVSRASIVEMSMGTAVFPSKLTGGGARSKFVIMATACARAPARLDRALGSCRCRRGTAPRRSRRRAARIGRLRQLAAVRQQIGEAVEHTRCTAAAPSGTRPRRRGGLAQGHQAAARLGQVVGLAAECHPLADVRVHHEAGRVVVGIARRVVHEDVDAILDADRRRRAPTTTPRRSPDTCRAGRARSRPCSRTLGRWPTRCRPARARPTLACSQTMANGRTARSRPSPSTTVIDANNASRLRRSARAALRRWCWSASRTRRPAGRAPRVRSRRSPRATARRRRSRSRSAACGAPVGNQLANGQPPGRITGSGM